MSRPLQTILCALLQRERAPGEFRLIDPLEQFDAQAPDEAGVARSVNAAFLIALAGPEHPAADRAAGLLDRLADSSQWGAVARFYRAGLKLIPHELEIACGQDPRFEDRFEALARWVSNSDNLLDPWESQERLWAVFCPEAAGVRGKQQQRVDALRQRRRVQVTTLNADPITDPAGEILFTSNVLLTVPATSTRPDELDFSEPLKVQLRRAGAEPQLFWYDHPIQIGVAPDANEVLYGLRGLQSALDVERNRGNVPADARLTCVLSVSVTHRGLQSLAKRYLVEEFARSGGLRNLDVFVFTEEDAQRLVDEVLAPAAEHYLKRRDAKDLLGMFGVDGDYGRHYSFLKAISAFWSVCIDPAVRATFKIDLDQVFPQEVLVDQSGSSAFEHFMTPLWGVRGVDPDGRPLELGMIAGALVNERDIATSLFTPDVPFPRHEPAFDQCVFFSALPQALSTEAEMMTRYKTDSLDGKTGCIQRIHVTGGTNGILIDSLRRHRPFTPSFIGRAEDQAYIFSAFGGGGDRLAYVHKPGLIMRHDKEAFAQEAVTAAHVGQLIADYVRILYFSAYARVLASDVQSVKDIVDPFTGCFISRIPVTVVYLRFALKAAAWFREEKAEPAQQFVAQGARRIAEALEFVRGENSQLRETYEKERRGWDLYYETLSALESALEDGDPFAAELCRRAKQTVGDCVISGG